jgi:tetratricopeptide (TPR) repeat protein
MKRLIFVSLLFAAPLAARETASQPAPFDARARSDRELVAMLRDESDPWTARPCELGVPLFGELEKRFPDEEAYERGALFAGAMCDDTEGDYPGALKKIKRLEAKWPTLRLNNDGFYLALRMEDAGEYLSRLRSLDDEELGGLNPSGFWGGVRMLHKQGFDDELEDLMLEWIEDGRMGTIPAEMHPGVSRWALTAAVRRDRIDMVPQLLGNLRSPSTYIELLGERRFEPIWPVVADRAGPNLDKIADEYVFWATGRLENHPQDRDRFSTAARVLHYAGRFEDAIVLARGWREREGALESIEEGDAWALNIEAYAHDALGNPNQADAIFDQLAELDPAEHHWVVNFVINRASRLVGQERWEEGLEAAALARNVADKSGTPFARMIIARDHVCALNALGKTETIADELQFLRENRSEFYPLAAQALMCVGKRDEAAALLIEGIEDERFRSSSLEALRSPKFDLFYTPSKLPDPSELLDESPELKALFETYARVIPEEFVPTASIRAKR